MNPAVNATPLFSSFFMAGFECTTHVGVRGYRHDVLRATRHDVQALEDYGLLREIGIRTVREGLRWPMIEPRAGQYRFADVLPMLRAARDSGTQVIWDLMHFGIPEDLDVFSAAFVDRFEGFARAFLPVLEDFTTQPWLTPVNEVSFLAFAGGDAGFFAPFQRGRGHELKQNLVRASIAATRAALEVNPRTRFMQPEPVIQVVTARGRPWDAPHAAGHTAAHRQTWDMIAGRMDPELGGEERLLDVIGVNYYPNNQWEHGGPHLRLDDTRWRRFADILEDTAARYAPRGVIVSETGAEMHLRQPWLAYIASETERAVARGAPVHGICWYPILDHPGWDDDRHVRCGVYGFRKRGERRLEPELAIELERWRARFEPVSVGVSR
jgi:beta-glucosidase/6-phospho-beta-glucosidase/beta-galactosidase